MPELDFEKITLNAIPDGEMPVFHASQFETMRPFIADLKWGSEVFAPGEGCWCTLSIRKTDDTLVIIDDIDIVTNTVSCILTQQSVACVGDNFCQLKVWSTEDDEDKCIACLNFILHVQPDPEAGGITSESEINNLTEQIEEITQQVIGDDYYDKTDTDALLDAKADKSDTYTKSETNTLLSAKADASSVYTKSETNTLLSAKADASSVYTKSETNTLLSAKANSADLAAVATTGDYDDLTNKPTIPAAQVQSDYAQSDDTKVDYIKNKPDLSVFVTSDDLNEIIYELLPAGTASGAIANFDTDLNLPLVDCKANIVASQASGTPTPSTPLPISGYSSANIVNTQNESIVDLFSIDSDFRGTVAFNQLVGYFAGNAATISNVSTNEYKATSTALRSYFGFNLKQTNSVNISTVANNIYFMSLDITELNVANITGIEMSGGFYKGIGTSTGKRTYILKAGSTNTIYINATASAITTTDDNFNIKNVNVINLTEMFGSTIADYIYSLEQNNAGAGVEFFRSIYPDDYYTYDSGTTEIVGKETPEATIAFGQTVYGGVLDVTRGKLTVTHANIASYNGESINEPWLSSMDTYVPNTTPTTGAQVVYPLTTPVEVDLTPVQINALLGVNNVFNDTNGDTEVKYKDGIQHYIDTRI